MSDFELTERRYGFRWGPADVIRSVSEEGYGVCLTINTPRECVDIRITPSGLIRVGNIHNGIEGLGDE